jgi:Protein of unknown function (DUF1553)
LVQNGWHLKALHREIVTSRVYRQASAIPEQRASNVHKVDPKNRMLSHFSRRRLSGEEIRDAMLCIAGQLNSSLGGPSVVLPVEQQLVDQLYKPSQWEVTPDEQQHHRRSIYLLAKRNLRHPFLEVFDQPSLQTSCGARQHGKRLSYSTVPLRANSPRRWPGDCCTKIAERRRKWCVELIAW